MSSPIPVIVNAGAGSRPESDAIAAAFRAHGVETTVHLITEPSQFVPTLERVLAPRPAVVVAAGGDGTISSVASRLLNTGIALGVLPLGTLNHFARDAGIPSDMEGAVATIVDGAAVDVDVGTVNDHPFINNSSIGVYPHVVRIREWHQHRRGLAKWPAFVVAAILVLRRYALVRVHLSADGTEIQRRTPLVFVGNNRYVIEGLDIGRRTALAAGELTVCVARVHSRLGLLGLALRALVGRARKDRQLDAFGTSSVTVSSRRRTQLVAVDGEVRSMRPPLCYAIVPGALRVMVPQERARQLGATA